jgi:hypothetical protein
MTHMKKIQFLLLGLIFCYAGAMAQSSSKTKYLKPSNYEKKVVTKSGDKSRNYYSLDTKTPSIITLQGPGILRVITRGGFAPNEDDDIRYEILYTVDGGEQQHVVFSNVGRSKKATYQNGSFGVPGDLKDFEINLGRGNHTVELFLKENGIPVAARYKLIPTREKKLDWIRYSPLPPCEPVDLITKESTVNYYRFSVDKPLKVEINGPTQVRVLTRVENHIHMKGRIVYRVQVKENDKVINTYQLNSRRSEVTVYKDDNTLIPGTGCEFVIEVPKGNHTYEILSLDQDKNTVLGRLLIPVRDVKLVK